MEYREDIGFQIRTLSHLVKRTVDQAAFDGVDDHPTGVQGWIIGYLYRNRDKEVFQRDIQEQFSIRRSTVTGMLQQMERDGLIRRDSVEGDGRLKCLIPTQKAIEMDERVRECLRRVDERLTQGLTPSQLAAFRAVAAQMAANLDE